MSKLMGKIILRSKNDSDFEKKDIVYAGLSVRYLKTSDSYEFKGLRLTKKDEEKDLKSAGLTWDDIGERFSSCRVVVSSGVMSAMITADKMDFCYQWSIGYETREKLGRRPGDLQLLRDKELKFISESTGGDFSGNSGVDFDLDSYFDLSVWQYLFNISETILKKARILWKKRKWNRGNVSSCWLELKKRENFGGRLIGSHSISHAGVNLNMESEEDFKIRIAHNKKVALNKGFLAWYLDTCKEECKRLGKNFDKEKCVEEYGRLRAKQ